MTRQFSPSESESDSEPDSDLEVPKRKKKVPVGSGYDTDESSQSSSSDEEPVKRKKKKRSPKRTNQKDPKPLSNGRNKGVTNLEIIIQNVRGRPERKETAKICHRLF